MIKIIIFFANVNFIKEKYGKDLLKNFIRMVSFYLEEIIQMEKDADMVLNIMRMVNCIIKENI